MTRGYQTRSYLETGGARIHGELPWHSLLLECPKRRNHAWNAISWSFSRPNE